MTTTAASSASTSSVYECPDCGEQTTDRRCPDCHLFTRRLGAGGHCPSCDELVLIDDILTTSPARSTTGTYTDNLTSSGVSVHSEDLLVRKMGAFSSSTSRQEVLACQITQTVSSHVLNQRAWSVQLDRASRAGYDVQQHLPRLAFRDPLPEHHPARALHYRLIQECDAAVTPRPHPATLAKQNEAAQTRLDEEARRQDNQQALRRSTETTPQALAPPVTPPPIPARPAAPPRERGPRR